MNQRYLGFVWGIATGAVLVVALGGLRTPSVSSSTALAARKAPDARDGRRVVLTSRLAQRAKLETLKVKTEKLAPTLQLVGSVAFDANEVAEVGARIEGRVTHIWVGNGDVVAAGQPLAEIESDELGKVVSELLGARANLVAAEHNEQREATLFEKQLSSAPLIERARAEVKALRAQMRGAEQRLLAMGLTEQELKKLELGRGPGRITLRSPLAGEVVDRYAALGQVIGPTEPVLRVANLDRLWVELDLYEGDLARVATRNEAEIESETYPGKVFRGRVSYVDASVDMATRTASVRIDVDNAQRLLRPGQFVRARLSTVSDGREALRIPRKAVLQIDGEPAVFVVESERTFAARSIELGLPAGDWVEVARGLVEGEQIVTAGAFALKSELLH